MTNVYVMVLDLGCLKVILESIAKLYINSERGRSI